MERMLPRVNQKLSGETRLLYGLAGGALVGFGLTRRSRLGGPLVLIGADLLSYAATGHHLYEALGIDLNRTGQQGGTRIPHQMGVQVQRSVYVNARPEQAYQFVREVENLSRFLEHVKNVTKMDDRRSHWVVKAPAGTQVEWDAEIINDLPGELIAWRSINNPDIDSAGSIHFEPVDGNTATMVRVKMQYLPPAGIVGATVAKLFGEEPDQQLQDDLGRLKSVLESRRI